MAPQASPVEAPAENLQPINVFARMQNSESGVPRPNRAQVEAYLAENRRSAESLLAAFRLSGDRSLLQEAAEKYPNNPQVSFAGWVAAQMQDNASSEERRHWLDAFKQSAPDNALANYLSAQACFKSGQTDQAVAELIAASGKPGFKDYSADCVQNLEEAYLSGGASLAEAKAEAAYSMSLPQLAEMKHLSESLRDLATVYRQAGDESSAQAALRMGLTLGQRLDESAGGSLLINMTGLAIERRLLGALDPNIPYDDTGQTVQNELDTLFQRRESLKTLWKQAEPILQNMPDHELIRYFDRMKTFGELEALRWVMNRQAKQ
jgi:hypothetical protein